MEQTLLSEFNGNLNSTSVKHKKTKVKNQQSYFMHNAKNWLNNFEKEYEEYLGPKATWSAEIKRCFAEIRNNLLEELDKTDHEKITSPCRPAIKRNPNGEPTRYPYDVVNWLIAGQESYKKWLPQTYVCPQSIDKSFAYIKDAVVYSLNKVDQEEYWWGKD